MMSFHQLTFLIGVCEKNKHFPDPPPQKFFNTVSGITFLRMPPQATQNFIDRFQISYKNMDLSQTLVITDAFLENTDKI